MRRGQRKRFRLVVETLESRRLLAGVNVAVYIDHNGSRGFEPAVDAVAPNRLVYVDLNANGLFDRGEPIAVTDADGVATFDDLGAGTFHIGLLTNSVTQPQAAPIGVAARGSQLSTIPASDVLVASGGERWALEPGGALRRVGRELNGNSLTVGGEVVSTLTTDDVAWIVYETSAGQGLARFDLVTGQLSAGEVLGLADGESLLQLVVSGDSAVALVDGADGRSYASVSIVPRGLMLAGERYPTTADEIIGAADSSNLLALSGPAEARVVSLLDSEESFSELARLPKMEDIEQVTLSSSGELVLVARGSGVYGYQFRVDELAPAAILSEARAPISAVAPDGRFATGALDGGELIVWSSSPWQPLARSRSDIGVIESLMAPATGDVVLSFGALGLEEFNLAVAKSQPITLGGETDSVWLEFGVRPPLVNTPPNAGRVARRSMDEDTVDRFDPQSLGVTDPDGDTLWFAIESMPQHGTLTTIDAQTWLYSPFQDYEGTDFATIVAYDGQASTIFRLEWQVIGVNDPPLSISVTTEPLAEDSPQGIEVGLVSIVDVDSRADYRITTSDARFTVEHGRMHYIGGGLDFETEPRIALLVTAVDQTDHSIFISTDVIIEVTNVVESPTGIRLLGNEVDENSPGAVIGQIEIVDPDAEGVYLLSVSDGRFEIVGEMLKLRDDQQLDYEHESSITMTIRADDVSTATGVASEVTVLVNDRNDQPLDILLSRQSVEEQVLGGAVGAVSVTDRNGQAYSVSTSDPRFEVVDNILKLRDDVMLLRSEVLQVPLTLTASRGLGESITKPFTIDVTAYRSPWQNPRNPLDVNDDGEVTPLDILLIINQLNLHGSHQLPALPSSGMGEPPTIRPDTSGDGFLSPLDALLIINALNRYRGEGEGAPGVEAPVESPQVDWLSPEEERRRQIRIDRELESLLDQLALERPNG